MISQNIAECHLRCADKTGERIESGCSVKNIRRETYAVVADTVIALVILVYFLRQCDDLRDFFFLFFFFVFLIFFLIVHTGKNEIPVGYGFALILGGIRRCGRVACNVHNIYNRVFGSSLLHS